MTHVQSPEIRIIGSGNVAHVLSVLFNQKGFRVEAIISRNVLKGKEIADLAQCDFYNFDSAEHIKTGMVILAVSDDGIEEAYSKIKLSPNVTVAHTSGTHELLKHERSGVVWPIQTLRKERADFYEQLPIIIDSNDENVSEELKLILEPLSLYLVELEHQQRKALHIAAVFANNFTNQLGKSAQELARKAGLDAALLNPLLKDTFENLMINPVSNLQTGPAARGDQKTMNDHLEFLNSQPELQDLYRSISQHIMNKNRGSN